MENEVRELRASLERKKGLAEQLQSLLEESRQKLDFNQRELQGVREAQEIIQIVAKSTQEELRYNINDLVSLAMASVFEDPYKFELSFVIRRGRTEADLWFERGGERIHPLTASGGGVVDVVGFALRVALWALSRPRSISSLVLDEPFKHLSVDLQSQAGRMLKEVSQRLGLQIIMVSHVPDLMESADRVFEVQLKNGVSVVRQIGGGE